MNPLRTLRFAWARLQGRTALSVSGVVAGADVDVIGAPIVTRHRGSSIVLGDGVTLISKAFATALGVNHAVVLRTLTDGAEIRIANRVGISGGSICAARRVEIGEGTLLGANVTIADTDFHSLDPENRRAKIGSDAVGAAPVRIGRNVFIGTGSIVLKGVEIGDGSVIGAGSVVTKSIPANCIAAGNPCKVIRAFTALELEGKDAESLRAHAQEGQLTG